MNRHWYPNRHVSVTDAGMVIEIEFGGTHLPICAIHVEADGLRVRGQHETMGPFDLKFDLPPAHDLANSKCIFAKGILRIEVPRADSSSTPKPQTMLIYCDGCGKHFDITITEKGPQDYGCPSCGRVQTFDLEALIKKAIEQGLKMTRKRPGGRLGL